MVHAGNATHKSNHDRSAMMLATHSCTMLFWITLRQMPLSFCVPFSVHERPALAQRLHTDTHSASRPLVACALSATHEHTSLQLSVLKARICEHGTSLRISSTRGDEPRRDAGPVSECAGRGGEEERHGD